MRVAVLLAAAAAFAAAQDTTTVEGVVVSKVTGAGIANATVRFLAPGANRYEAHTDETGSFRITGVKPGDYNSSVEKTGYFRVDPEVFLPFSASDWPKHHVDTAGDPLRLRFELNPPAIIRGRVVGADGNPARASVDLGKGRTVNTNGDGTFVFENLASGQYTLLARPKTIEPASSHEGTRTDVVSTYYPSVVEPTQAESIVVRAGAELSGFEIRLQSVPVYRVRGVVLNPDGKPAARAVVELLVRVPGENPDRFFFVGGRQAFYIRIAEVGLPEAEEPVVTKEDGVFEFPSVRAGEWTVRAEGDPVRDEIRQRDGFSFGNVTFSVGRGDPDELKIQLAKPFNLSGVVTLSDDSRLAPGVLVAVTLYSQNGHSSGGANTKDGGVLQFDNVIPGPHEIRADVMAGNYYADSILLGSTDVTTQRVELTPASPPIKIILKPAGTIRGTIEDSATGTVVLFPQSFTGIGYSTPSGAGKTFELAGVPPGNYYAIALDQFDPRTMAEAVRLRSLMPRATSVKVEQGSVTSVQLKVNHVQD